MTTARPGLPCPCSTQAKTRDESSRRGSNVTGKPPLEICKFQTRDFVNRVSVGYIAKLTTLGG